MLKRDSYRRLLLLGGILTSLVLAATIGYYLLEGWSLLDSFYMTIITVTTVGFSEVRELSNAGKIFTILLIISSFSIFAYAIGVITNYFVSGEFINERKKKKLHDKLRKLENHVLVCGYGRVGRQVVQDLLEHNYQVVVIECNPELGEELTLTNGALIVKGNATDDLVLKYANINTAHAIISCLPNDAENLYVVLAAREVSDKIFIVSRASTAAVVGKLKRAGANNAILPELVGGSHMASLISKPDVMEFLDMIRVQNDLGSNVDSISFDELPEKIQNKAIGELREISGSGITIIGHKDKSGNYTINPDQTMLLSAGDKIFVLGNNGQVQKFFNFLEIKH